MTSEAAEDTPNSRNAANANDVSPVIIINYDDKKITRSSFIFTCLNYCMIV